MSSAFCLWLAAVEEVLWRMIRGAVLFACRRLPEWAYRTLLDTVGPVTVRLSRVLAVFCLWLSVLFLPAVCAVKIGPSVWGSLVALAWVALAISGSVWGHVYLVRKNRVRQSYPVAKVAGFTEVEVLEPLPADDYSLPRPSARASSY